LVQSDLGGSGDRESQLGKYKKESTTRGKKARAHWHTRKVPMLFRDTFGLQRYRKSQTRGRRDGQKKVATKEKQDRRAINAMRKKGRKNLSPANEWGGRGERGFVGGLDKKNRPT